MKQRILTMIALGFILSLSACQPSKFSGNSPRRQGGVSNPPKPLEPKKQGDDATPKNLDEEFSLEKTTGSVDMVWLIDTSGSMREEAAQVQSNFSKFASTLSSRSGTQFALIARKGGGGSSILGGTIGVDLGSSSSDRMQIDASVGSTNALAFAAAAVCPSSSTAASASGTTADPFAVSGPTICGQSIYSVEGTSAVLGSAGALTGFFRPEAKPVFVIVTDDNARGVTDQNFVSMVQPHFGGKSPTVYAFSGRVSRPGCMVAKQGTAYEALAAATGGAVFDICDSDWSPNFSKLGDAVLELIKSSFDMKYTVGRITKVTIDGSVLSESDYTVSGPTITLRKGSFPVEGKLLKVSYEPADK